ncbi:PAS domain S-box protein [Siminovitchia acidinfaciens]|uniref:PAS domain S-box protein n=2 Tax=Siminovitchia acidinfaciens TaxID=2321395 RepID=A0A429Y6W0_9BACI|nr:PAS domain S-box protein [Siminovitchia acidinfaciens]
MPISQLLTSKEVSFEHKEIFSEVLSGKKYSIEVKIFASEQPYIILCLEDLANLIENKSNRLYCLERVIDSLDEGVMMSNLNGDIVLYNDAQEKMEGLNKSQVIGKPLWTAYNYNPQNSEHKHVLKTEKPIFSRYRAHSKIDGVPRYVNYSTFPIQKNGETIAVFSISTNESLLKDRLHQTIEEKRHTVDNQVERIDSSNGTTFTFEDIKGRSLVLKNLIKDAQNIAVHNADVLIVGETGTGKELFAQSMHNHSQRANSPFVAVNCAAIPENLLESTLFGTVKGAFTGATDQAGLFEYAEDGTIFLDEINSMSMTLQSKLMRVLQERLVRRVGSNDTKPINCTVISASNEDPEILFSNEKMRLDLFYRIARTSLYIPPLRERPEDIHFFIEYFLQRYQDKFSKVAPPMTEALRRMLLQYSWPGNTRELEHLIENLMIRLNDNEKAIDIEHLPVFMRGKIQAVETNNQEDTKETTPFKSLFTSSKKHYITATLEQTDWNISAAARKLGISRQSLQYHIRKHKLVKPT